MITDLTIVQKVDVKKMQDVTVVAKKISIKLIKKKLKYESWVKNDTPNSIPKIID